MRTAERMTGMGEAMREVFFGVRSVGVVGMSLLCSVWLTADAAAQGQDQKVLNLVVRDAAGALVTDLRAEEIEILDGGVKQAIRSFRTPAQLGQDRRVVVLVFGGLSNQGRLYARRAAEDFLAQISDDQFLASVFVIDRRLYVQERFTGRRKDLEDAVKLATSGSFERYRKESERIEGELQKGSLSEADTVILDCLKVAAQMQKEDWTYAALDSLNLLVDELRRLPGRKAILFFSEGLVISDVMFNRFNMLVGSAAVAQTAVYPVDARGLLTGGLAENTRSMLSGAADASASQFGAQGATSAWQVQALEAAGQSVRMNAQETLAALASLTGGTLVANTNDARPGMRRIAEELNQYYEVTYAPALPGDGSFRQVVVGSTRPNHVVASPKAYFDLPRIGGEVVHGYEMPILALLKEPQLSNELGVVAEVLHFGPGEGGIQHTLALEAPMRNFTFLSDTEAKTYTTHFSLMALIKDQQGNIVRKISQDYPLQGPLDKMASLQSGNVLLLRNFRLEPGTYVLEAAARDNGSGRAGAVRRELRVAPWPEGPALSSVMIIDRVDPISDPAREKDNPLRYQDRKIAPNLGAPVVLDPAAQLGFYCVLYPAKAIDRPPVMALLFFKDGQPLFQGQPPLPPPDADGRVQVVLNLPMQSFQPGDYEVVAVVQQGEGVAEERTRFKVVAR